MAGEIKYFHVRKWFERDHVTARRHNVQCTGQIALNPITPCVTRISPETRIHLENLMAG
jgi:hypothetical protein